MMMMMMMAPPSQKGKFRPRLQQLIGSNSEEAVQSSTSKAFGLLPDVQAAITELCKLKGVGPATASGTHTPIQSCNNCNKPHLNHSKLSPSAVLAAGAPGEVAFMADEAVESIAELRPVEYTAKHYALFLQKMLHKSSQLNRGKIHTLSLNISLLGSYCSIYFRSSGQSAGLDSSPGGAVFMGMGRGQSDPALINTGVQSDGCNTRSDQSEAREEEDCWWKAIKETEENLNSELCTSLNFPRI